MDWVEILGLGATAMSGGLFGVLGSAFGAWMKNKERKLAAEEKKQDRLYQIELIKLQQQGISQEGAWTGLTASIEAQKSLDNATTSAPIVQSIKSLFRPFLTIALWVLAAWELNLILSGEINKYMLNAETHQALFSSEEIASIVKYIVHSTVFTACTAATWWFGERALSLPEMKNR